MLFYYIYSMYIVLRKLFVLKGYYFFILFINCYFNIYLFVMLGYVLVSQNGELRLFCLIQKEKGKFFIFIEVYGRVKLLG